MKLQVKTFRKDLYKKFLFFSILPIIVLSIIFILLIIKEKHNLILSQHTDIVKNIQYNINLFYKDIRNISELLKKDTKHNAEHILTDVLKYNNSIDTIMVLDQKGIVQTIASKTNKNLFAGYDYSHKFIFKEFKKRKKSFLSDVYFSTLEESPLIAYVFKYDKQIYIMQLNLEFINSLVSNLNPSAISNISISLIDKNGLYILDTSNKLNVKNRNSFFTTDLYKDYITKNSEGELIEYFNNKTNEDNYTTYNLFDNLPWTIVVRENNDAVDRYILNVFLMILLIIITIALVSIASAKKISNNIVNPIEKLILNINKFAKDNSSKLDNNIKSDYKIFRTLIEDFNDMHKSIVKNEQSLKQQIMENKQKDKILGEQSKMVAMGEMIGNIAHQWRQPLSVISTAATGMQMQKEYGILNDNIFNESCEAINNNAQYLSKTIDDFRNFIKGDRDKKIFILKDEIDSFIHLIEGTIKSNNIDIQLDLEDDIEMDGYPNELTQCMINIFNNAKDALVEKNIDEKIISITTKKTNDKIEITIKDNAGGIPQDILPHIFEPYFTTKHKSQGTGLGLNMTYNIITDGMDGTIEAINQTYEYENKEYTGAEFIITL